MQLFILVLVVALFAHDALLDWCVHGGGLSLVTALGLSASGVTLALWYATCCRRTLLRLNTVRAVKALRRLDLASTVYRYAVLGLYVLGLGLGTLPAMRQWVGDQVLLDEVLTLIPPLGLIVVSWWSYYPIDRRLREASLISHLDQGLPVGAVWSRRQYIISQLRHQVALTLVPLLTLAGWAEAVHAYGPRRWPVGTGDPRPLAMWIGAGVVFLFAPVMIRHLWDTVPLPAGELKDRLTGMCKQYRIGVRHLLLWRTFGGVVNAAVTGMVGPLRYILLTDALVEHLPGQRVEAVMAHELAHVLRHHVFWLMITAAAALGGSTVVWMILIGAAASVDSVWIYAGRPWGYAGMLATDPMALGFLVVTGTLASWILIFGWVSRRFERQADAFAVGHMARRQANGLAEANTTFIGTDSIAVVTGALQQVADLNHFPITRRSWRHGSIKWRQAYLRSLLGTRVDRLPIDRQVLTIKISCAGVIGLLGTIYGTCPHWLETLLP